MSKIYITSLLLTLWLGLSLLDTGTTRLVGNPTGAPPGRSGGPDEGGATCAAGGCHSPSNNSVVATLISVQPSLSNGYTPGTTYSVTVTANGSGSKGFQFSPQSSMGALLGTLIAPANLQISQFKYITHRSATSSNPASWTFQWIAPPAGSGTVGFYAAAVAGRNVNLYRQTLSISEATGASVSEKPMIATQLKCWPVPSRDWLHVSWNQVLPGKVSWEFFDQNGRQVAAVPALDHQEGPCQLDLSLKSLGLTSGHYTLRMQYKGQCVALHKIVLAP